MKRVFVLCISLAIIIGFVGLTFAAYEFYQVTKLQGNKITLKNDQGKQTTITGNTTGLKVGDKVRVENGKIIGPSTPGALQKTKTPGSKASIRSEEEEPVQTRTGGSSKSSGALQKTKTPGSKTNIRSESDPEEGGPAQMRPAGSVRSK